MPGWRPPLDILWTRQGLPRISRWRCLCLFGAARERRKDPFPEAEQTQLSSRNTPRRLLDDSPFDSRKAGRGEAEGASNKTGAERPMDTESTSPRRSSTKRAPLRDQDGLGCGCDWLFFFSTVRKLVFQQWWTWSWSLSLLKVVKGKDERALSFVRPDA